MKNKLFPPKDNKVVIEFEFFDDFSINSLDNFMEIVLEIGGETYSTVNEPSRLYVLEGFKLVLNIGDITSLEDDIYFPTITGYNAIYDDGYVLTSDCNNLLAHPVIVCR